MTVRNSAAIGALLAGLVGAPALADLTADEVWASWKGLAESSGQTLTGTESRSGDTLTVSDLKMSMEAPGGGRVEGDLGRVAFTERGDGSVEIALSESYPISVRTVSGDGENVEMDMSLHQTGMSLVASGDAARTIYDVEAPEAGMTLDRLIVDGEPVDMSLSAALSDLVGSYTIAGRAPRSIDSDFRAASGRLDLDGTSPDDGATVAVRSTARDIVSTSSSTVPEGIDSTDLGKMLEAGFASKGSLGYIDLGYTMTAEDANGTSKVATTTDSGSLDFVLADGGMVYDIRGNGTDIVLTGSQIPVPQLDLSMAESAFRFEMPLVQTEEAADFGVLTRITGLKMGNDLWAMIDPAGQLPRDPANLLVDLEGKGRWLTDITDPDAVQGDEAPGQIEALNVKDLQLDLAGAELTGQGAFTFDNSKAAALGTAPMPAGDMSLKLVGGNALLDKLVGMGLIPQDKAMGFRMMLGLFAQPGEGEDTLVSKITVTEDGQVLANGQRLR